MAIRLTYMVHGTTQDNIDHLASGHNDIELAPIGIEQGKSLGVDRPDKFDVIFTSDLKRAIDTATLAFEGRCPIIQDKRLRECDYGDLTQVKKTWSIKEFVNKKYPNGENYLDVEKRIKEFVDFIKKEYDGKHIGIVAHQGPQLALDVIVKGMSWDEAIDIDWRNTMNWQPGWEYDL